MPGKNSGVCHDCRVLVTSLAIVQLNVDAQIVCADFRSVSWLKGTLQTKANSSNGFWEWCKEGEASGESSNGSVTLDKPAADTEVDDVSKRFESQVRLHNDEEMLISVNVNVTISRPKPPAVEREKKGKDTA